MTVWLAGLSLSLHQTSPESLCPDWAHGLPGLTTDHGAEAPGCWLAPEPTSGAGAKPRLPHCHPAEPPREALATP